MTDNFDFNVGKHAMRVGMLLESGAYINADARNSAGTFTFSSLEAFLTGAPNTFTQRLGQLRTAFSQNQLGLYWQDDYRLNRSLAMSVGVREELQIHVGDAMNFMPRLGFTYTPQRARATIRGGYGVFHDWYDSNLYDQTLRVTGAAGAQRDLLILNPGYPDPTGGVEATVLGGGRVQADPDLQAAVRPPGVDRHRATAQSDAEPPGVVHVDARTQPAAFTRRERTGCLRRAARALRRHGEPDRIDRPFGHQSVQREPPLPGAWPRARS